MSEHGAELMLQPKLARIVAALLHIMKRKPDCDQYDLVKAVFLADRAHLNRYGRPITYDNYYAMEYGPVPSTTYDVIMGRIDAQKELQAEQAPWRSQAVWKTIRNFHALQEPDYSVLSESDIEELDAAVNAIEGLDFEGIHEMAKNDEAYQEAWARRGDRKALPMKYELLLDAEAREHEEDILHVLSNS